jgi:hypothetical protein
MSQSTHDADEVAEEVPVDTAPAALHEEEEEEEVEPPSPAAAAPDDRVLVAGMHAVSKKKKGRGMSAALALLAKDRDKDKKEKKKDKGEKASNLLLAANVVRHALSALHYCDIMEFLPRCIIVTSCAGSEVRHCEGSTTGVCSPRTH